MSDTYAWVDADQTFLRRIDAEGNVTLIGTDPDSTSYQEFLASGAVAAPYVAPPEPAPQTTEEKVNRLLSDLGLTRSELLTVLEAKPAVQEAKAQLDTTGVDQLLPLDTKTLLDLARANNIMVEQHLLDPANHEALANYIAAAMNLKSQ